MIRIGVGIALIILAILLVIVGFYLPTVNQDQEPTNNNALKVNDQTTTQQSSIPPNKPHQQLPAHSTGTQNKPSNTNSDSASASNQIKDQPTPLPADFPDESLDDKSKIKDSTTHQPSSTNQKPLSTPKTNWQPKSARHLSATFQSYLQYLVRHQLLTNDIPNDLDGLTDAQLEQIHQDVKTVFYKFQITDYAADYLNSYINPGNSCQPISDQQFKYVNSHLWDAIENTHVRLKLVSVRLDTSSTRPELLSTAMSASLAIIMTNLEHHLVTECRQAV